MQTAQRRTEHIASSRTMQAAYSRYMDEQEGKGPERPIRITRRERLKSLIKDAGGPKALAAMGAGPDTHLIACEQGRRNIGDDLATKLEKISKKPFGWMDEPVAPASFKQLNWFEGHLVELYRDIEDEHDRDEAIAAVQNIANRHKPVGTAGKPYSAPSDPPTTKGDDPPGRIRHVDESKTARPAPKRAKR